MSYLPETMRPEIFAAELHAQFEAFLDDHRSHLWRCLDGLTEEQARRRLVSSKTTLLGLVKHAAFIERVWFDEAISGRPRGEIGIPETPDESFDLTEHDTIDSVRRDFARACDQSRQAAAELGVDEVVAGNRRGALPMRWIYLHQLRELAQHGGHADILREQVLADCTP